MRNEPEPLETGSRLRVAPREPRRALSVKRLVLALYFMAGLVYIYQSSFVVGGTRYFTLWDDAMISMRYAQNLHSAGELSWNVGDEPVQGFSNLGVVLILATLHTLPLDPEEISLSFQIFNLLLLLLILHLVYETTSLLFERQRLFALAAMLGVALYGPLAIWSLHGADCGIVSALVLLALWRVTSEYERSGEWPWGVFPLLALGLVVRLDFAIVFCVFLAGAIWIGKRRLWHLMLGGALFVSVISGLMIFGLTYYGDPLPNTYYLKAGGFPQWLALKHGALQIYKLSGGFSMTGLLLTATTMVTFHRRNRLLVLASCLFIGGLGYSIWVGGDWLRDYPSRFLVPTMPIFSILFVGSCRTLLRLFGRGTLGESGRGLVHCVLLGGVAALAFSTPHSVREWWTFGLGGTMLAKVNKSSVETGLYLKENTDPSMVVAFTLGGIPPYFSERFALDTWGRSDRHIARLEVDHFAPGHSKEDWGYILQQRRPDILSMPPMLLDPRDRAAHQKHYLEVRRHGQTVFYVRKGRADLLYDPEIDLFEIEDCDYLERWVDSLSGVR